MLSTGRQQAGLERGRLNRRAYDDGAHDKSDSYASQTSVVRTTERRDAHDSAADCGGATPPFAAACRSFSILLDDGLTQAIELVLANQSVLAQVRKFLKFLLD